MSPDTPASGSRWEPPSPRDPLLADEHAAISTQLTDTPRPQGATAPGAAPRGRKKLLAGAAVVVLLALGGVGGYWLGHSTTGSAATAGATAGPTGHGHRRGGGFSDDGPGAAGSGGSAGSGTGGSAGGSAGAGLPGSGSART